MKREPARHDAHEARSREGGHTPAERAADGDRQPLPLPDTVQILLDEGRMVLPGIQALFGF
jgi:hypothetical protein